jgi:hypothetical protein
MSTQPTRAPWDGEDSKPVYLVAAPGGVLEAMAEDVRTQQVANARTLHAMSGAALNELPQGTRFLVVKLRTALGDLLRLLEG